MPASSGGSRRATAKRVADHVEPRFFSNGKVTAFRLREAA